MKVVEVRAVYRG